MRVTRFGLFILVAAFASACTNNLSFGDGIRSSQIKRAQEIYGLEYTKSERKLMRSYLERNREGYQERLAYPMEHQVGMPLYFDPKPNNYQVDIKGQPAQFVPDRTAELPKRKDDLAFYSIEQLAGLLRKGLISSKELTLFFLNRIERYDDSLQAAITITRERALAAAKVADEELWKGIDRGILHGIPYGIKDLFSTKDYPTTWGAAPYKDQLIEEDAAVIEKLSAAGAILLVKLSSGALASGDVWFGGETKNPWNLKQGASGSSAGSGAAVSAGLVPFALGTETWGSILSPSGRCGISGLRPTFGRVSRYGCMTLSWTMDKVGPMTRSARDCAIVLNTIAGPDVREKTTVDYPLNLNYDEKPKLGYFKEFFEGEVSENDSLALLSFREAGYELIEVDFPEKMPYNLMAVIIRAESGAVFDQLVRSNDDDLMVRQSQWARPNTLRQSHFIPAVEYIEANRYRYLLIEEFEKIFEEVDVIISPSRDPNQSLATNLSGHPAMALPSGLEDNQPSSITIVGRLYEENKLLKVAEDFQKQTQHHLLHPPKFQ